MSNLLIKPAKTYGRVVHITPESAGWTYVGFDLWKLKAGQIAQGGEKGREVCLVFISGTGRVSAGGNDLGSIGERVSPFAGKPWSRNRSATAAYNALPFAIAFSSSIIRFE